MARRLITLVSVTAAAALGLSACGGGASDVVNAPAASGDAGAATSTINLYAYAVPKVAFDVLIPAFQKTAEGKGVQFQQSYGASGDQSRKVAAGATADFVNFSVEPDVTRLVDAGLVDASWNQNEHKGIPFGSVVTVVVRKGNPKGIKDWDDLLKSGVEVVTPNPFSSGSAKWNLLAPYAAKSNGGQDKAAGLDFVRKLVTDHVKIQPKSGREATEAFLQGSGDVLLSYENEALFIEKNGDPVEHVTPPTTFKIENPAAVLKGSPNVAKATAFDTFLYTPEAQKLAAEAGFRPVDETVAKEYASKFPAPTKLWTIADLGGWKSVDSTLFKKDSGDIATIYDEATK
ncbi:sulfate ABC transporter substrate-binding protein [Terracoccus luteus]|uniref:Sulfate transport system substrate-binding protein n=1 Tax=Terracoccus luteus TaxID=53356 RepID=A0A839PS18_9MICO|nr:sulfate ABC transporter substrate-binding protein [Terracoccus luteus]MBB2986317.1 sulfate transport system substrate-binding protein [Terracoccus luteus]MCP2172093.1 sulfate transport system substrate-binding protein [Terracoccus luteus]